MPLESTNYGTVQVFRADQAPQSLSRHWLPRFIRGAGWMLLGCLILWSFTVAIQGFPWLTPWESGAPAQPDFTEQTFFVGFDLTAGYGTAAISYRNGTTVDVARTDGDEHYREVMARLSLITSTHATPPYYGRYNEGYWHEYRRQSRRRFRKWRGLPASEDVSALANVLEMLKGPTEALLDPHSLRYAIVTVLGAPYQSAIYNEDLRDACEHVGIQFITLGSAYQSGDAAQWPVYEFNTAYAGMGLGVCGDPNQTHCSAEETNCALDSQNVLVALFTRQALAGYVGPVCNALHLYLAIGVSNYTLGLDSMPTFTSPEGYWNQSRSTIRKGIGSYPYRSRELSVVISHGECATDNKFQEILQEEVLRAQDGTSTTPRFVTQDPVFSGARGAAELAKRGASLKYGGTCIPDLRPKMQGW